MDYEMESTEPSISSSKDGHDKPMDTEWQIDSDWINLSSTPPMTTNNKKNKQLIKQELPGIERESSPSFHFIPANKGGRNLVVDNQPLRLSQKKPSGYSYWVCSIPCCTARCVLDPTEKKIVRICTEHNHEADVSRQEYKMFINALKMAVRENPQMKPKALYDAELEKARDSWQEKNLKNNSNEEGPCLPSFDAVRTAMYNSRNSVLSAVSLKATGDDPVSVEAAPEKNAGPSRSTRSRDAKANPKRKSTPSKTVAPSPSDLEELDDDDDETDEEWKGSPSSSSKQNSEDINFYFMPSSRGCQVLIIDGCLLHQNTIHASGKSYWRCQKKSCFFRAVYDPKVEKVTKTTGLHNHPPDSNQMMRRQFINNVKYRIMEHPHIPAKQIYDTEVQRVNQEHEEQGISWKIPPFSCVKHHAYKARKIATMTEEVEEEEEEMTDEQPIKREITDTEKKFLEESAPQPQEEESAINMSLLSSGPAPIRSKNFPELSFYFIPSKKGKRILVVNDFTFRLNSLKSGGRYYWKCTVDPCMYRCVYNENLRDLVKVSGKHTHASNVHRLRTREFYYIIKARIANDPSLTPKKVYDQEVAKIRSLENGETLVKCLPAYSSIRTSLYNQKHKRLLEDEQGLSNSGTSLTSTSGFNNYCPDYSHTMGFNDRHQDVASLDQAQDISPKDITHLSLEDNDPMDHDDEDRGMSASIPNNNNPMEITAPSLYDNHDIIDQYCGNSGKGKIQTKLNNPDDTGGENQVITMPDPSKYSLSFVPTTRGGRALVVNGCVLRISYTREYVTYWRCLTNDCPFRCSYDSQGKKLLRISGEHNHPVNRYSPIIRTFVRKIKKRVCQENDLSPKIIYDEELGRLKETDKDPELISRLPSYDSLKSTLYKVKNKSVRASSSIEEALDFFSDSDEDKEEESQADVSDPVVVEDPPDDPLIEEGFATFNAQLPSWLEQEPDKKILDGHVLVKKSSSDASTGWACAKEGCPFRCVVDAETNAVTRSQWDHTHNSVIKHTIAQAMLNAVKRRAVMDPIVLPKVIYAQERKRIIDKVCGNKMLHKFIPNLTQVYQLVTKTRANPPPPPKPKAIRVKLPKLPPKKKSGKASGGTNSSNSSSTSNNSCGSGQFEADYLLEHCEDDSERVSAYIDEHEQQQQANLMYEQNANNVLSVQVLDNNYNSLYQQNPFPHVGNSYTNTVPPHTSALQATTFNPMERQIGFTNFGTATNKPSQGTLYSSSQPYLHQQQQPAQLQQQQQPPPLTLAASMPPQPPPPPPLTSIETIQQSAQVSQSQSLAPSSQVMSPNSENVFTLHGYPLLPAMTQMGNIYWQCKVPGCRFQCVFNAGSSQIVQISGNHNHEPPGSQSAFCSQVIKMLQRKSAENLDEPLSTVYWEYMKTLRDVLDSEEIISGLPRFHDVAMSMQSARSAMGVGGSSNQFRNLVTGNATQTNRVYEFHFDSQNGSLVVNGDPLTINWSMNELSYWRCKRINCRFKCVYDDELQCVHILNNHTHPCPSNIPCDDRNSSIKRKYPDKPSPRRPKFQRMEDMKPKSGH